MSRIDTLKDSVSLLKAANDRLAQVPDSDRYIAIAAKARGPKAKFWRIGVPGQSQIAPEEFYAPDLRTAYGMARVRWPWAPTLKCVGSRE